MAYIGTPSVLFSQPAGALQGRFCELLSPTLTQLENSSVNASAASMKTNLVIAAFAVGIGPHEDLRAFRDVSGTP